MLMARADKPWPLRKEISSCPSLFVSVWNLNYRLKAKLPSSPFKAGHCVSPTSAGQLRSSMGFVPTREGRWERELWRMER